MGKAIPVLIGLIASILGIGGLANKVMGVIKKIRQRIVKAITAFWKKVKKGARKLLRKVGVGKKNKGKEKTTDIDQSEEGFDVGEKTPFYIGKEKHHLWVKDAGVKEPVLMMASVPEALEHKIKKWRQDADKLGNPKIKKKVQVATEGIYAKDKAIDQHIENIEKDPTKKVKESKQIDNRKHETIGFITSILKLLQKSYVGIEPIVDAYPQKPDIAKYNKSLKEEYGLEGPFAESHHVPENKLMSSISDLYDKLAGVMAKHPELNGLTKLINDRNNSIKTNFKDGHNLPALTINVLTHRLASTAVHSKVNGEEVIATMKSNLNKDENKHLKEKPHVIVFTKENTIIAKAQSRHWQSFLREYFKIEKDKEKQLKDKQIDSYADFLEHRIEDIDKDSGLLTIRIDSKEPDDNKNIAKETEEEITKKLGKLVKKDRKSDSERRKLIQVIRTRIENSTENAFNTSLHINLASLTEALKDSMMDGDPEKHEEILKKIKSESIALWLESTEKRIVGKFVKKSDI